MFPNDLARYRSALHAIPSDLPRPDWVKAGMAAHAAGLSRDDFMEWSASAPSYKAPSARATWQSFKSGGGISEATLVSMAKEYGWKDDGRTTTSPSITAPPRKPSPISAPKPPAPGMSAAEIWSRCEPATAAHGYAAAKGLGGAPLETLRVVPAGDPLRIARQSMAGCLVVPAYGAGGVLQSLQLIPPPGGTGKKLNLPGAPMTGASFTVGELAHGATVYVCEGIGQAWACWRATGSPAVVAFGWGNVARIAADLHQRDNTARLVLCPDAGKETEAAAIARELGCAVAYLPHDEPDNFDAADLAERDGDDALAILLEAAREPAKTEPRYKLLGAGDLRNLPPLAWRVRGVLPAVGLAALYGASASGKSFLAFDMAAAIAEGKPWFDCRVIAAPVVYCALEGEAGFKLRAQAWEVSRGRSLPDDLHMMLQPFNLTEPQDVYDLAAVVPAGAVVILDTLNRAAPMADENSSRDMGEILQAAKTLQAAIGGLVLLVHHTGKNAAAGLRGHSSLFAAMDAAVEVTRDGDRREWRVAKSKDGQDGGAYPFKLNLEVLGTEPTGESITSCVVLRDTQLQDVRAVKLPQGGNQRVILDALRPLFKDGTTGKPGAPPLARCIELEAAVTAGAGKLTCQTDRRATRTRDAITGLVARGVMSCNEGWLWMP